MLDQFFIRVSISGFVFFFSLLANSAEVENFFEMSLEELLQVKISGSTRTEESLLTVPSSATIYTHEDINRLGVISLEELMNYVSGFQARRSGNNSLSHFVSTRGHISGTSNRNILILVDGQRLNSNWNGGVGVQISRISLENVNKVEFIRGAGSSLYGSNAFSAVINITTSRNRNEINTQLSSNSSDVSVQFSTRADNIEFSSFVSAKKDSGFDYSNLTDTIDNGVTSTKDPYRSIDFYLQSHYGDFSAYIAHNKSSIKRFYLLRRLSDRNYRNNTQSHLRLTYDFQYADSISSQLALSYLESSDDLLLELAPQTAVFAQAPLLARAKIKENIPSIEWFNSYTINTNMSLQFGMEFRRPDIKRVTGEYNYDIINRPPLVPFYNPDFYLFPLGKETSRDVMGVYAQYQTHFLDNFQLTLGFRYDDYSDFGSSLNPRIAFVYRASEQTSFKFLYSEAFRAPSRNELDLVNNGVLIGNPDLMPEETSSYEAIVVQQFEKQSISFSYYVNQIDDIIIEVSQADGTNLRENAADGNFRGTEIEYIGEVRENFQIRASYSYIFSKPDFAFKSSDSIFSTSINYIKGNLNINLSTFHHSAVKNDDNGRLTKIPSYAVINTKLNYRLTKRTNLYAQMKNLLDNEYFAPSAGSSLTFDVPSRGRESFIGIEVSF